MVLSCENLSYCYGSGKGISDFFADFHPNCFYALAGPNGSGKSTLLKLLSGFLKPQKGSVSIDRSKLAQYSPKQLASHIAFVPQTVRCDFPYPCAQVVEFGLYAKRADMNAKAFAEAVCEAMAQTSVSHLAARPVTDISGGEFQRLMIAQALVQSADILLLDEPLSHLDIGCQREIMEMLRRFSLEKTVIISIHDLTLASFYCDQLLFLKEGRLICSGEISQVFTENIIADVFDIKAKIIYDNGKYPPFITPRNPGV